MVNQPLFIHGIYKIICIVGSFFLSRITGIVDWLLIWSVCFFYITFQSLPEFSSVSECTLYCYVNISSQNTNFWFGAFGALMAFLPSSVSVCVCCVLALLLRKRFNYWKSRNRKERRLEEDKRTQGKQRKVTAWQSDKKETHEQWWSWILHGRQFFTKLVAICSFCKPLITLLDGTMREC